MNIYQQIYPSQLGKASKIYAHAGREGRLVGDPPKIL
jgi:hypothetical protein